MRFREHRGSLSDSLDTMVEIDATIAAIVRHVNRRLAGFDDVRPGFKAGPGDVRVNAYYMEPDRRTGWAKTYIVVVDGYGPFGFCDQAVTQ
jgi:hypothetical protein